ncbi:MAG: anthranilate synthase component I family protein [Chitinophagaceae bacterium]|jgi:anthranilate synthase component 1|nr:anthranilate synthase component I family protein [Chitinophagaceae bacterium]MCA6492431.1 anthranilate synthase component I family protein [Chitinophagaceae bacterium]MCA6497124.1 anthranilate synthase component I family protein [Chitinophagaceae bacterium]MCA6512770.1 anthranilate synthase component I family protein [Chitinophagaceae bacterium]
MQKINFTTHCYKMLGDMYTPVGIYLRLRDQYRDTILLESTDHHAADNSYSFIGIHAIAGIEISDRHSIDYKLPGEEAVREKITDPHAVPDRIWQFMQQFQTTPPQFPEATVAQGLFGYTSYDAVPFFESIQLKDDASSVGSIPLMRYRFYQYVIVFNHFKDEIILCENKVPDLPSDAAAILSLIRSRDIPVYPFALKGNEQSNMSDEFYRGMVEKGIAHCLRGDVFQVVLSRRFEQAYQGDVFNVYRSLRSINPSPYLFFFDYGAYQLMGSSPEAQIIVQNGQAIVHPIAGTFRRSGDEAADKQMAEQLLADAKENAEHIMLVDLARNDLSRQCDDVQVRHFREVQYYSHVIHLVSEVAGQVREGSNPLALLAATFPAGTLSGAPKIRAMEIIHELEPTNRGYYGGCIGTLGFDGSCNHAILIRSLLSRNNTLYYQAGAGVVAASQPESELQEVNNKLNALKSAILFAGSTQL